MICESMRVTAVLFLLAVSADAQWINYPTAGVPRSPSGAPNLAAPAPRTADGKPDLSGLWVDEENRPCPPYNCDDMLTSQQFWDIGWGLKGGVPYQPWAADLIKQRAAANGREDPTGHCLPGGIVKLHSDPLYRKIVQVPGLLVILNERNASYRQIFTDGRPLPQDPQPAFNGYSTGKWDRDTLVVETNGFREGTWLDRKGSPLTENGKVVERFRRVNFGRLEIEITVDDPKAYTAPWTVQLNQNLKLDTELLDYICLENEKDVAHYVSK
ncbi:MAG: hypothetical protein C5B51_14390 [Terriglobia bacterium]|nr:MAG: hypothetical protein C5B51_14390 [Terriglobia bacterium]